MIRHVLLGVFATHVVWALVFGVAWFRLVRRTGRTQESIREDFASVRETLLGRTPSERN